MNISDGEIKFCQYTVTDRANLINCVENVETYIENVIKKVQSIMVHSYIAKAQSEHLQKLKNEIKSDSIIFLGDFVENYRFVVQDEVQSFHWRNLQATQHPVVIYYKENEKLKRFSYCVISNDMEHDVAMIYQVQNEFLKKYLLTSLQPKMLLIFQTVMQVNIKTGKIYSICVNIVLNSELMLNGSFLQLPMESNLVME